MVQFFLAMKNRKLREVVKKVVRPAFVIAAQMLDVLNEEFKLLGYIEHVALSLDYGLRCVNKVKRILNELQLKSCIPDKIAEVFRQEGREQRREKEIRRECLSETRKLDEWLDIK